MEDWQERVSTEYKELLVKIDSLTAFREGSTYDKLDTFDKRNLTSQLNIMLDYLDILHIRIQHFKDN